MHRPMLAGLCLLATACDAGIAYRPALGEIMALQQVRHAKLWFAGEAGNWQLAAYELEEIQEGYAAAMEFHPQHQRSPVPLGEAIPRFSAQAVAALRTAIEARDEVQFAAAFDSLTAGCNGCHQATQFAFNVVVRPTANTFSNQDFAAGGR